MPLLLKADKKLGRGDFRLGRVLEVFPDEEGIVRTVTLGLRRRRGQRAEGRLECKQGLEETSMAVQRLVVLVPREETWQEGFPKDQPSGGQEDS